MKKLVLLLGLIVCKGYSQTLVVELSQEDSAKVVSADAELKKSQTTWDSLRETIKKTYTMEKKDGIRLGIYTSGWTICGSTQKCDLSPTVLKKETYLEYKEGWYSFEFSTDFKYIVSGTGNHVLKLSEADVKKVNDSNSSLLDARKNWVDLKLYIKRTYIQHKNKYELTKDEQDFIRLSRRDLGCFRVVENCQWITTCDENYKNVPELDWNYGPLPGWEKGFEYSADFKYIVPAKTSVIYGLQPEDFGCTAIQGSTGITLTTSN